MSGRASRALFGHADLLRIAASMRAVGRDVVAEFTSLASDLGFERVLQESAVKPQGAITAEPEAAPAAVDMPAPRPAADVPLWQPITFTWHDHSSDVHVEASTAEDEHELEDMARAAPPQTPPLSPRSRLAPLLLRGLTTDTEGRALDVPALVRGWSRGQQFRRLPRLRRRGWPTLVLLLDRAFHLVPFWDDQVELWRMLREAVGGSGVVVRFLDDRGPDGPAYAADGTPTDLRDGSLAGLPVLALTDLGWYGGKAARRAWLRLGRQLRRADERLLALVPVPSSRWTAELSQVWAPVAWERPHGGDPPSETEQEARASRLLDLAAHVRRLEPGLLRSLRRLLPLAEADVGVEADAWRHADIAVMCADATVLHPERALARRARLALEEPVLQTRVVDTIHAWHWHRERRPELWHTEALLLAASGRGIVKASAVTRAQAFMAELGRRAEPLTRTSALDPAKQALRRWLDHTREQAGVLFDRRTVAGRGLQAAWWATHDPDDPPPDADPTILDGLRPRPAGGPRMVALRQVGDALEIWSQAAVDCMRVPPGGLVAPLWAVTPEVFPVDHRGSRRVALVEPGRIQVVPVAPLELRTDCATLGLRTLTRSDRAPAPSAYGRDHHGLWRELRVWNVEFRMRWIPPGRFVMGSPASEPGRWDDEGPQREVVISRGFWLGETPVTQALWTAVMSYNPSRFKDPARPVELVSWEDAAQFVARIDELLAGADDERFRLPTEAEWEYACRAGTTSATYAGELENLDDNNAPILDAIAWYGGNSGVDYDLDVHEDSSGWRDKQYPHTRAGTRRVKQKRPNQWGLYDMLGNVWEWCMDAWEEYRGTDSVVLDPLVVGSTDVHWVSRGGSWNSDAGGVRAACRNLVPPGLRFDVLGLRLARGQERQGPEGQPPGGR